MTEDHAIVGAATVVLCVVAGSAVTVGCTRVYALAKGHGMDGAAALLVAVSLGGLMLPPDEDRPVVMARSHPSWAEVDAEQRERLGYPPG